MHQTKKGNQFYFGMKLHVGADVDSGLVHTVVTTAANEADVNVVDELLHGREQVVYGDAGYVGTEQHVTKKTIEWKIARRRSQVQAIRNARERVRALRAERKKVQVRARVELTFRVIKRQFGYVKVRFKGLAKDTAQLLTLVALSNLYLARKRLLAMTGNVRPLEAQIEEKAREPAELIEFELGIDRNFG